MEYKLGELIDVKHGYAFKGEDFSERATNRIILTPGNVKIGGGFKDSKFKYLKEDQELNKEYVFLPGDIFINMTDLSKAGDTLGSPAIIPSTNNIIFLHNQRLGRVNIKNEKIINKTYLYYLLCTRRYRGHILGSATGSTVKHTSPTKIKEYIVDLPSLERQNKIGGILKILDEKILNNEMQINLLENISQTLFKHWFIDFEFPNEDGKPYKSSGGEMVKSELGEIPEGWEIVTLSDLCNENIITGKTPSTKVSEYYSDSGTPFITIPEMHKNVYVLKTNKYISQLGTEKFQTKMIPKNSILVSCIATPGLVCITNEDSFYNQQINGIIPNEIDIYYLYNKLSSLSSYIKDLGSGGSTTLNLNKKEFSKIKIINPTDTIKSKFNNLVKSNYESILELKKQNINLEQLRDTLLPKLLSDEIEIPDDLEV